MSNRIMNLILLSPAYLILPVFYYMLTGNTKPKKNIVLGVTLPYAGLNAPPVRQICLDFKKKLRRAMLILAVIPLPAFFFRHVSLCFAVFMNWMPLAILLPYVLYARERRRLLAYKKELLNGRESLTCELRIDLSVSAQLPKPVSGFWYLGAVLAGLFPLADILWRLPEYTAQGNQGMLPVFALLALLPPLCCLLQRTLYRQNPDVAGTDSTKNAALTRIRRRRYSLFCLSLSWGNAGLALLIWALSTRRLSPAASILTMLPLCLLLAGFGVYMEMKTRWDMEQLAPGAPDCQVNDEDRYWIGGIFYYNPQDRHNMKDARVGFGTTVNLARPFGRIMMLFGLLCLLLCPVFSLWTVGEEFTPLTCQVEEESIVVRQLWTECTIPLEEIRETQLLEELPSMWRTWGSSIGELRKGRYQLERYGSCQVYLDSLTGPFLLLDTDGGRYLLPYSPELAVLFP